MDISEKLDNQQKITQTWASSGKYEYNQNDLAMLAEVKRWHGPKERKATMSQTMYKIIGRIGGSLRKGCVPWNKGKKSS